MLYRVIFLLLLTVGLLNCGGNVLADPATPLPTTGIHPNIIPAQPTGTPNLTPPPTFAPDDPNAPASNETPITPKPRPNHTRIHGRITNENNAPLAGARITIPQSSQTIPEIAYLSDAEGNYLVSVPFGQYTFAIFADGYVSAKQEVITHSETEIELNWVLKQP